MSCPIYFKVILREKQGTITKSCQETWKKRVSGLSPLVKKVEMEYLVMEVLSKRRMTWIRYHTKDHKKNSNVQLRIVG